MLSGCDSWSVRVTGLSFCWPRLRLHLRPRLLAVWHAGILKFSRLRGHGNCQSFKAAPVLHPLPPAVASIWPPSQRLSPSQDPNGSRSRSQFESKSELCSWAPILLSRWLSQSVVFAFDQRRASLFEGPLLKMASTCAVFFHPFLDLLFFRFQFLNKFGYGYADCWWWGWVNRYGTDPESVV